MAKLSPRLRTTSHAAGNANNNVVSPPSKGGLAAATQPISKAADGSAEGPRTTLPMTPRIRTMIGLWIIALAAIALGHLPWAWSLAEQLSRSKSVPRARWLGLTFAPHEVSILLVIVVLTAVIGSAATLALTFAQRAGYDSLERGWVWWYLTRPFTAAGIGVLAYALLQVGFFGSNNKTSSELLAAAAIGGLAGLFTDQLLQKMRTALGLTAFLKSASDASETAKINAS